MLQTADVVVAAEHVKRRSEILYEGQKSGWGMARVHQIMTVG